jgi:tetratricopeptide (TPR) repeat protein
MGLVHRIGAGASAVVLGGTLLLGARDSQAHAGLDVIEAALADEVARRPKDPALRLEQAQAFEAAGEWDRALAALDEAAALGGDVDQIDGLRGRVLVAAGRHDAAKAMLDRLIARLPSAPGPRYQRGLLLLQMQRPGDAARDLAVAVDELPSPDPSHVLAWRDALVAAGQPADAIAALDRGMLRVGSVPSLELAAVDLEERLGRLPDALRRIDRLIATSPRNPAWVARRGELLERVGSSADARTSYAQALAMIERRPLAARSLRTAALEARLRAALARSPARKEDTP